MNKAERRRIENYVDRNFNVSITVSEAACDCIVGSLECKKKKRFLVQLDGGNYEDYIGRFLCETHLKAFARNIRKALTITTKIA